jgi:hypothetical protein
LPSVCRCVGFEADGSRVGCLMGGADAVTLARGRAIAVPVGHPAGRGCRCGGRRRSAARGHAREYPRTKLALKGPLATPVGGGFRSVNVRLREEFSLFANVRPARTIVPGQRYEDIDIVLVRENIEDLYVAFEHYIPVGDDPKAVAISSGVNTRRVRAASSSMRSSTRSATAAAR